MDELLDIVSCFENGGYGDRFFQEYYSLLTFFLPDLQGLGQSFDAVRQAGRQYCGIVGKTSTVLFSALFF